MGENKCKSNTLPQFTLDHTKARSLRQTRRRMVFHTRTVKKEQQTHPPTKVCRKCRIHDPKQKTISRKENHKYNHQCMPKPMPIQHSCSSHNSKTACLSKRFNIHESTLITPPTCKNAPDDKATSDQSYFEEYNGLVNVGTWEVITEDEYKILKHLVKKTLPTMAIAVIKKNGQGNADQAKYRIVALGNLDPHDWSKDQCFAPILAHMELRFLISLAVKKRRIQKSVDISQAFCQSFLPDNKIYICTPPHGCPITPSNIYWRLRKTLYGLKQSPHHFYELAKKILTSMGMKQSKTAPCLFYGTTIEAELPIYLGLYVNDFMYYYFSESDKVEEYFETEFQKHVPVTFDKEVDYFLGIKFQNEKKNGHVSIKLSQAAYVDEICKQTKLDSKSIITPKSPYRSGLPVDSIPDIDYNEIEQKRYTLQMQTIIGSLKWLSVSTCPDITTNLSKNDIDEITTTHLAVLSLIVH